MDVSGIDERRLVREGPGANFVVFVYEGGGAHTSWSVDSFLLTGTDLPEALRWLEEHLPTDSCWSLGVVLHPEDPTPDSDLDVRWIVGADVLNMSPELPAPELHRLAAEMLARRHRTDLP